MDSTHSNTKIRRKAEAVAIIRELRKKTKRNVPLALFYLSFPLFILFGTDAIRIIHIGQHDFVDAAGLVALALALCFVYAASMKLFVRASDEALLLLAEEIFKEESDPSSPAMLNKTKSLMQEDKSNKS